MESRNKCINIGTMEEKTTKLSSTVSIESVNLMSNGKDSIRKNFPDLVEVVETKDVEQLEAILSKTPSQSLKDVIDYPNEDGETALHRATLLLNVRMVEVLLKFGANPNLRDDWGEAPLHLLTHDVILNEPESREKMLKTLLLLINNGNIDMDAINNRSKTPLESAALKLKKDSTDDGSQVKEFCKILIKNGAVVNSDVLDILTDKFVDAIEIEPKDEIVQKNTQFKVFNYIIQNETEEIKSLWENEIEYHTELEDRFRHIMSGFIGSNRILFHFVNECDEEMVSFLLDEVDVDPFVKNGNGEMALHRSLARSSVNITKSLISKMKEKSADKGTGKLDLGEHSNRLIAKTLQVNDLENPQDSVNCLNQLLEPDITIDTSNALHVAASFENKEAIVALIANGAYIGERQMIGDEDKGTIIKSIMKETLTSAFDRCIAPNDDEDPQSPNHTVSLNYEFLLPRNYETLMPSQKNVHETSLLHDIRYNFHVEGALKHPLIQVFLFAKWRRVRWLYYLDILIYLFLIAIIPFHVFNVNENFIHKRIEEEKKNATITGNYTNLNILQNELTSYLFQRTMIGFLSLVPCIFLVMKELLQFHLIGRRYFYLDENYLEWMVLTFAILMSVPLFPESVHNHLTAWTMILASYAFVLSLGRIPMFTLYISFMKRITYNYLKVLLPMTILFLAFSFSFTVIHQTISAGTGENSTSDFHSFWISLPRTLVMSTGELEYSSYSESQKNNTFYFSSVMIFLMFVFLIYCVLTNVLTGIAVSDVEAVKDDILLNTVKSRLQAVYTIEKYFHDVYCRSPSKNSNKIESLMRNLSGWFLRHIQILNSKKKNLTVRINEKSEGKRITYERKDRLEEEKCSLNDETLSALRCHYLSNNRTSSQVEAESANSELLRLVREMKRHFEKKPATKE